MEILERNVKNEAHILCYSFAVQGHLNPIIQFCKRLASKGLKVTLVTTTSAGSKLIKTQSCSSVSVELLNVELRNISSNETKEGERDETQDYFEYYKSVVAPSLATFIEKQMSSQHPPKFLVYDSVIPWALGIAKRFGIDGAPFFTQSWSVSTIYYHFYREKIEVNPLEDQAPVLLPSLPPLKINELPSFLNGNDTYPSVRNLCLNQFSNTEEVSWLFFSSFDKLEEVITWMASQLPVKAIGPTIPSKYLDNQLENDKDYGLNLFKPNTEACMKWLHSKQPASVIYVSFGSLAALQKDQMEEIAWGLKNSNAFFLWVVRESESEKLPKNFSNETFGKGLVVSWCSQLEVLAHTSVGCFMTHCGWNSTLEAVSVGVPVVAMPQFADQTTNAKFIEDVWGVGVRVKGNEEGIVTREEIENRIREVMELEGERGKEIRKNAKKWKDMAKEAVDKGGSSDKNIEEFVEKVLYL